jgi:hypothetical protein
LVSFRAYRNRSARLLDDLATAPTRRLEAAAVEFRTDIRKLIAVRRFKIA